MGSLLACSPDVGVGTRVLHELHVCFRRIDDRCRIVREVMPTRDARSVDNPRSDGWMGLTQH